MAVSFDRQIEHLLRRAGFGARRDELDTFRQQSIRGAVALLIDYESVPDDVDQKIQQAGYVQVTTRGAFSPRTVIADARQRWLFRMVHGNRPLQEKMTLFWHNHFATAYSKIAGIFGGDEATRYMAAKASEDPGGVRGQIEMLRDHALGNFRDILVEIAKDTAMLVWLDGYTNLRARPQENFGREILELFTMGIGHYTEADVYAAARVFTGWNLQRPGVGDARRYTFLYNPNQHDPTEKTFTFPIYPDGRKEVLSAVNNFQWNWHVNYIYADHAAPLLPKGTVLVFTAWHDNTAANPNNPDPRQWVGWGDRTVDEMAHAWVDVTYLEAADFERLVAARKKK